jgi:ribosomal protein S25
VKGHGVSPNAELTNHVLDEELQKKIAENACLLSAVSVSILASKVGCACSKIFVHKVLFSLCSQ